MYTVKRIIDGDIIFTEHAAPIIGPNRGKPSRSFREAVEYVRNPSALEPEAPKLADLKPRVEIQGSEGTVLNGGSVNEITGVTLILNQETGQQNVAISVAPGERTVEEALGVLVTEKTTDGWQEIQYDFIYPGEQVYVTDRFGNTVESLR